MSKCATCEFYTAVADSNYGNCTFRFPSFLVGSNRPQLVTMDDGCSFHVQADAERQAMNFAANGVADGNEA